ncbi:MAG: class II aldolase/adducin family protein [Desulfotomaculales bacterium]
MSVAAEKIREQVARYGSRMATAGLVAGTWGNLSARVPKEECIVITPSGLPYNNLTGKDMVVLNMQGEVLEGERRPSTEYMLHLAIYRARPDVNAILHTHSIYASALAVVRKPIPPILEDLVQMVGGGVPVAPYARAGTKELARVAAETLGSLGAVLLANHGVVGVGRTLEEALVVCQIVEKSACVYLWSRLAGDSHVLPPEEVKELREVYLSSYGQYLAKQNFFRCLDY